jgi:hypothetical protein
VISLQPIPDIWPLPGTSSPKGRPGAKKSNEQTFCYWLMLENLILKLPNFSIQAG